MTGFEHLYDFLHKNMDYMNNYSDSGYNPFYNSDEPDESWQMDDDTDVINLVEQADGSYAMPLSLEP